MNTIAKTISGYIVLGAIAVGFIVDDLRLHALVDQHVKTIAEQRKMLADRYRQIESLAQSLLMADNNLTATKEQMEKATASMRTNTAAMEKATQRLAYQKGQIETLTTLLDGCTGAVLNHRKEHHAPN